MRPLLLVASASMLGISATASATLLRVDVQTTTVPDSSGFPGVTSFAIQWVFDLNDVVFDIGTSASYGLVSATATVDGETSGSTRESDSLRFHSLVSVFDPLTDVVSIASVVSGGAGFDFAVGGIRIQRIEFQLIGAFSGDDIPFAPDPADFFSRTLSIHYTSETDAFSTFNLLSTSIFTASLDIEAITFTEVPVPEPGGLALLGTGVTLLALRRLAAHRANRMGAARPSPLD